MTEGQISEPSLQRALQQLFGFDLFLPGQERVVQHAVAGIDTLALMPTGAGKSLCYQLAAMLRPSPTLVLSPLIALMKDQLDKLPEQVSGHASLINSSLSAQDAAHRLQAVLKGEFKLVYAAPERLRQRQFVSALRTAKVGLVVIDEVHCVSMWGHDFRPDYLFIRSALEALGDPPVLGLTATATGETERDIAISLGRKFKVIRSSIVRTNLRYEVRQVENEDERREVALATAKALPGSGIIYARSREKCEQIALLLRRHGMQALHYHAGLDKAQRSEVQERFLKGQTRIIVATIAFGMGIDKPDIRWILLYNLPASLESYVQMVGRAGRDGQRSLCLLFCSKADAASLRRFARQDIPTVEDLRSVYRQLKAHGEESACTMTPENLSDSAGLRDSQDPRVLVGMLEKCQLVSRSFDSGRALSVELLRPPADASKRIQVLLDQYQTQAEERSSKIIGFAESLECRHHQVAMHFGETVGVPCGLCDVCAPRPRTLARGRPERSLPGNIADSILQAVDQLPWPLGHKGLVATLRGSIDAPPSAQKSPAFGILTAADQRTVSRWVGELLDNGNLQTFETGEGFKFKAIRVGFRGNVPTLSAHSTGPFPGYIRSSASVRGRSFRESGAASVTGDASDQKTIQRFERLRTWRLDVSRESGVPAFTVAHDSVLQAIAAANPADLAELISIRGLGPKKTAGYGLEILGILHSGEDVPAEAGSGVDG